MAYGFTFDLSKLSKSFFADIARFSGRRKIHEKLGGATKYMVKKFNVEGITGLPLSDSITVIEDLIDMNIKNLSARDAFLKARRRALFLPHCSRKYMDSRCKAKFIPSVSSYQCMRCSRNCLVNKATEMAKKKGYDVYVVPGGSVIKGIMRKKKYEGVVGVACTEEIKLGSKIIERAGIPVQAVPLLKNGCSATKFNLATLGKTL